MRCWLSRFTDHCEIHHQNLWRKIDGDSSCDLKRKTLSTRKMKGESSKSWAIQMTCFQSRYLIFLSYWNLTNVRERFAKQCLSHRNKEMMCSRKHTCFFSRRKRRDRNHELQSHMGSTREVKDILVIKRNLIMLIKTNCKRHSCEDTATSCLQEILRLKLNHTDKEEKNERDIWSPGIPSSRLSFLFFSLSFFFWLCCDVYLFSTY